MNPIATDIRGEQDQFGPICARCYGTVYLARIESGRPIYRHVDRKPRCLFPPLRLRDEGDTP